MLNTWWWLQSLFMLWGTTDCLAIVPFAKWVCLSLMRSVCSKTKTHSKQNYPWWDNKILKKIKFCTPDRTLLSKIHKLFHRIVRTNHINSASNQNQCFLLLTNKKRNIGGACWCIILWFLRNAFSHIWVTKKT